MKTIITIKYIHNYQGRMQYAPTEKFKQFHIYL
jgi:hypothetical protein